MNIYKSKILHGLKLSENNNLNRALVFQRITFLSLITLLLYPFIDVFIGSETTPEIPYVFFGAALLVQGFWGWKTGFMLTGWHEKYENFYSGKRKPDFSSKAGGFAYFFIGLLIVLVSLYVHSVK